jgi:hypothetical protein
VRNAAASFTSVHRGRQAGELDNNLGVVERQREPPRDEMSGIEIRISVSILPGGELALMNWKLYLHNAP